MLNSKKSTAVFLATTFAISTANAQFFDINEQGSTTQIEKPTGNYQSAVGDMLASETVDYNPAYETSGDEGGFVPTENPDENSLELVESAPFNALPVAEGFDAFSQDVSEETISTQFRTLDQLDYVGFLDSNFDDALWLGVSYDYAKARFANFDKLKSVHVRNIVRNMLVAKARAPQSEHSWLELRMDTLLAMGKLSDVKLLFKEIKPQELESLQHAGLNSLYLKANMLDDETIEFVRASLEQEPTNLDYKKSLLINLYKKGEINTVRLSFNALKDANAEVQESNFGKLFNALLAGKVYNAAGLKDLDVFDQYVIGLNPTLFENINYDNFTDETLLLLVKNSVDKESKVKFAEILMDKYPYSYNVDYLTSAYDAYQFAPKDISTPLNYVNDETSPYEARALFYQASKVNGLNSTKALSLKKLWESYTKDNLANIKFLITEKTQNININSSVSWFSIDLLKNQLKQAEIEYPTLKTLYENIDNADSNSNILNLQIAVEFLRKTSVINANFDSIQEYKETLQSWFDANHVANSAQYNYVLKVLTLLDALEAPIPDEMWSKLYESSNLASEEANPVWLRLITSSIAKQEKGKALILIAEKFDNQSAEKIDPQTLANIIATLNFLNMPREMALIGVNAIVK